MKITDYYDRHIGDHRTYLAQEAKILGVTEKLELTELSDTMFHHKIRLCEIRRAMRNYIENPFGKYFYTGS